MNTGDLEQRIYFDESDWPIIFLYFPPAMEQREFDDHIERMLGYLDLHVPFAVVNDIRRTRIATASQRRRMAEVFATREQDLKNYFRANAIVSTSAVMRGALTALGWLKPHPMPTRVFSTVEAGFTWVRSRLSLEDLRASRAPGSTIAAGYLAVRPSEG